MDCGFIEEAVLVEEVMDSLNNKYESECSLTRKILNGFKYPLGTVGLQTPKSCGEAETMVLELGDEREGTQTRENLRRESANITAT